MAGQFDKFVKILGTGSRPARFKGAPGNPNIVAPIETNAPENTEDNKNRSLPANAPKQASANAASKKEADASMVRKHYNRNSRKRQIAGLSTTTMRLNEQTNEAYDSSEVVPPKAKPDYVISGTHPKRPKRDPNFKASVLTDSQVSEIMNPGKSARDAKYSADAATEATRQDLLSGENAFNARETASGSTLRSLNGVTYDLKEYKASLPANQISKAVRPYDISEFEPKTTPSTTSSTSTPTVASTPTAPAKSPIFKKVDVIKARRGGTVHSDKTISDFEKEHPDSDASSAATGKTLSEANKKSRFKEPSKIIGSTPITEPDMDVVEEKLTDSAQDLRASMTAGKEPDILSTTMREVPSGRPDKVLGHIPVRSPRELAGYEKPKVNKPGNVIPPVAIDTFGAQPTDRKQAEAENKRLRENRSPSITTTVFDQNVRSARPVRGQTPERAVVLGAIREKRSAALASEGKTMTTVAPEVMDTAKRLGRTSAYNLDESYMSTPGFLSHEAIQKATVAHALGVHHTLGTDDDHLAKYLGGRPLEAKSLLATAYKVVDRNLRGNPEKNPGEFAILRASVHAGITPSRLLRNLRAGKSNDVVVNGQNVQLAEGSSENRQKIANTTSAITAQTEAAPKILRGSMAATINAPLAGSNRVGRRKIGEPLEKAVNKEFTPAEARNPLVKMGKDDSKGPKVIDTNVKSGADLQGLRPRETSPNKVLKEEKDS
jgi:hypothetical protein